MNFVWEKDCLCSPLIHYNNLVFSLFCHFILFSHIPDITKNPNLASHKFHRWEPDNLKNRGHKRKGVNSVKINYAFMGLIYLLGFPNSSDEKKKKLPCNAGDPGSIPGSERSSGEGNGNSLQYSYLKNFMDRLWGCKQSDWLSN